MKLTLLRYRCVIAEKLQNIRSQRDKQKDEIDGKKIRCKFEK